MRPDPGRDVLERIHADMDPAERAPISQRLREDGFRHVWAQVGRTEPMGPAAEGMFILDRLYPEMPAEHRESIRRQMHAAFEHGEWSGFRHPPDPGNG